MTEPCAFCGGPVNPHDESTFKQVAGWVHGRSKDGMTLREDTKKYAHESCILKAKAGVAPDQPSMFDDVSGKEEGPEKVDDFSIGGVEEIFEKVAPPPTIRGLGESLGLVEGSFKPGHMRNPVRRCDAYSRKGTGFGTCDFPLDEHGNCARAGSHVVDF